MQETWVQSPSWKDPLEKEMASQHSCLENPGYSPWGGKESDTTGATERAQKPGKPQLLTVLLQPMNAQIAGS